MKTRIFGLIAICLLITTALLGCGKMNGDGVVGDVVQIDLKKSYFDDFNINNDKVYLLCTFSVTNTSSKPKEFRISADFTKDQKGGLLLGNHLDAYSTDYSENKFSVKANESIMLDVCFIGRFGGMKQKQDRLLPDNVSIVLVN